MPKHRNGSLKIVALLLAVVVLTGCFAGSKKARILERADAYFKAGEYEKAKVEYLNLLRLDNQNARAFQQIGFIWMEEGAPLRAAPFLLRLRELAPNNIEARKKLALALMAVGQATEARKEALAILEHDPSNSDAVLVLVDSSQTKEEIADAEHMLQKFSDKNTAPFHLAMASLTLKKGGGVGAAFEEVQKALSADPNSAPAHSITAYLYLLRKDPAHAGEEFKKAAEVSPLRSNERIKYAEFQVSQGAVTEAEQSLREIVNQAPNFAPAWRVLAQIAFNQKKYDEALSLLENIFARDSENPDGRLLQSSIWIAKGDTSKAISILDTLNNAYPGNAVLKYQLARAYLQNKNVAQAAAALEQAVAINPNYIDAALALAELNLHIGKPQAVVTAMEDLIKRGSSSTQAQILLADGYRSLGQFDNAEAVIREQIKSSPQSPKPYLLLGLVLRQANKRDEARKAFEKAAELAPEDLTTIDQLIDYDITDKDFRRALQRIQPQLEKNPQNAALHFLEGKIYAAQERADLAEPALQQAIKLDPELSAARDLLIAMYVAQGKLPKAIDQLEAALAKHPDNQQALMTEATIYEKMNDFEKARNAYEKVLVINPNSVAALNNLAVLYSERLHQSDKAYEVAQKARTLEPGNAAIADTLGWVLYARGDYQQALSLLQESSSKIPDNAEIQFHLGMASYMMGQKDAARAALEKAVRSPADFPGKTEAQNRLAQLQTVSATQTASSQEQPASSPKAESNDLIALLHEAENAEKQGDAVKAASTYERAFKLNPKLANTAVKLAELNGGPLHQPARALEFARKANDAAPNDPQVSAAIGRVALLAGNVTWAYSLLQESARRGGDNPAVLHDLAMATYALGKISDARQTMQRALDAKPVAAESEDGKRFLAMTAPEPPPQSEVEAVLKAEPNYVPGLMAQAAIDLKQNDSEKAAKICQDVLKKYPDFAPAQKQLAMIYGSDPGKTKEAYEAAIKARKELPDDAELARTLARLSFKRNEFPYAAQLFQESAAKQPLAATDLYYLGVAQFQSRQEGKGRETLQQALAAGLQEPLAQDAKKRLAEQPPK